MKRGSIFETDGIPHMSEALPLAMQHVVAMIVGCVTPAIIVSGAVPGGLSREDQVILIQSALVIAALSTLLQLFPIGGKAKFAIGSGLPIIMGVSFAYVPSMQAIAESYGIAAIMGAEIVGGIVAVVMGLLVKKIRVFFPPLITGTVVFTIGLSLYPTAINYMAGGTQQSELRILAELGNCIFHADRCYSSESFWKGNLETGIYSDRYYSGISGFYSVWNGRFLKHRGSRCLSASISDAFWSTV